MITHKKNKYTIRANYKKKQYTKHKKHIHHKQHNKRTRRNLYGGGDIDIYYKKGFFSSNLQFTTTKSDKIYKINYNKIYAFPIFKIHKRGKFYFKLSISTYNKQELDKYGNLIKNLDYEFGTTTIEHGLFGSKTVSSKLPDKNTLDKFIKIWYNKQYSPVSIIINCFKLNDKGEKEYNPTYNFYINLEPTP